MPETAKPNYSKEFWKELFNRYYGDEIIQGCDMEHERGAGKALHPWQS